MRIRALIAGLVVLIAAAAAGVLAPGGADAAKVANPGTFTATVTDGFLRIKNNTFDFDPNDPITFTGTIQSNGAVNIPESGQNYPPIQIEGGYTVRIMSAAPITGTINPLDGSASLLLKVWIKIDGVPFGGGCRIASRAAPIVVNSLITGTTSPPGPNRPITGTPYNTSNGTMKVVNNNYSVPTSSDCGPGAGTVNDTLGLPSSSGNNEAQFVLRTAPILRKGITAALAVSGTSGVKPYTVDFDASASTHAASVRDYKWDFDGDGIFDRTTNTSTTSFTYVNAGTYNAKMRITDTDGDFAEATRTITVFNPPDLTIDSSHADPFRVGTQGRYNLDVQNLSSGPTNGGTTVTDTLPNGLEYVGASGSGWSCSASGQTVTCARSGQIPGNASAPTLVIDVNVTTAAIPGGVNTATVSTPGDSNANNDTDTDPTTVTVIDLALDKSHDASFRPGSDPRNVYSLAVTNLGSAATVGSTTVTDTLPAGLTYRSATGTGWSCNAIGQQVSCTRPAPIPGGGSPDPIRLEVDATLPDGETTTSVVNNATVTTAGDAFPDNDSDSDPTLIIDAPDLAITKSHDGTFTAGGEGVFELSVFNDGPRDTTATTTVTDTLPFGLTYRSATGTGWDCSAVDQDVTCLRPDPITADTNAPTIELRVGVGREAIPSVENTASVDVDGDENAANDSSMDTVAVRAIDLAIDKSHSAPFRINRQGTYHLDVDNVGDSETVGAIEVEDSLPAGLTYVDASGAGWSCGASGQDVTCTNDGPIGRGESAPRIDLRVEVGQGAVPGVSNTATVATTDDFNPDNNSDTDSTAIVEADASVSIRRTGSFVGGTNGTYLISVDNAGSTPTTGATTLTTTLPEGLAFVSAGGDGWSCSEADGEVTCVHDDPIESETPLADVALRVAIANDAPSPVTTTVEVSTPGDRNPDNDTATDTANVLGPDLTVASAHSGSFRVGSTGTYTLSVSNGGNKPTRGTTTLTDNLPQGLDYVSAEGPGWECSAGGQVVTCTREAEIAAGSPAPDIELEVLARPAASPSVINEVSVSTVGDRDASNDSDSDRTDVEMIDLRLRLDRDGPVTVGGEAVYQVAVDNVGSAATVGPAHVTDTLPTGVTPNQASGEGWACSITGQSVACDHDGTIGPDEQAAQLTIRAHAGPGAAETVTNTATVSTTSDGNPANDSDTDEATSVRRPDLKLNLDDELPAGGSFRVGEGGSYRLTVLNQGGLATTSPTSLSVEVGEGMTPERIDAPGWVCSTSGRIVDCEYGTPLAAGERSDLGIEVSVGPRAGDEATTAAAVSTFDDSEPSNDSASRTSPITRIDLKASKDYKGTWQAGKQGSYELGVENLGSSRTVGPTTIRDRLPEGITLASATGNGWSCRGSADALICSRPGAIAASAKAPLVQVSVDIGDEAVPSVTATATVTTEDDVNVSNDSATDTIQVLERDRLSLPATLAMKRARPTRNGIVYVRLGCPDESETGCTGRVALESTNRLSTRPKARKRRRVDFGSASFDITHGHTYPAPIRLSRRHRRILDRFGKLRATVTIETDGFDPVSRKIVLRDR